jgi:hypothetical protein
MPQSLSSQVKPIAPKGNSRHQGNHETKDSAPSNPAAMRGTKRKMTIHPTLGYAIPPPIAPKVARRNARERNRVKQVNCGFEILRNQIPTAAKNKKMSKVDTLRHAVDYIRHLKDMLTDNCDDVASLDIKSEVSDDSEDKDSMSADVFAQTHLPNNALMTSSPQHHQQVANHQMHHNSALVSPNSIMSAEFSNPGQTILPASLPNEVTFDRINFYTTHNSNMMSPMSDHPHNHHQQQLEFLGTQPHRFPNHHLQSTHGSHMYARDRTTTPNSVETSPSVYSESSAFFTATNMMVATPAQENFFYSDCLDPNSEEDELLDAIVKWQED